MPVRLIEVPNAAAIRQAGSFLRNKDWKLRTEDPAIIRFHPSYCHMQPWVLAALSAWSTEFRRRGGEIRIENEDRAAYGWRFGLAEFLGVSNPVSVTEHEESGRFVALRRIQNSQDLSGLLASLVALLHLSAEPEHAKAVQYAVSEMVRNTLEHSESESGAVVAAQLYAGKRSRRRYVSIGIADTGVGVRETISRNYVVNSHEEAILKAIQPGVTGAVQGEFGSSENAGAGLFITRRVAAATNGYFGIASGSALFRSSIAKKKRRDEELVDSISFFPGTIVCVEIGLGEEADFGAILESTRAAFTGRVRRQDRRQGRVRFT